MPKLFNKPGCNTLQEVQDYLHYLPFVNFGGCGLSALAMYRWLKKHNMTSGRTNFYFLNDTASLHSNNKRCLAGKNDRLPCACGHVVLRHKGVYIDCHGEYDITKYRYKLKIKEKFLVEALNNLSAWNSNFPRKLAAPRIEKKLNISLADVVLEEQFCFEN
jgi:hypothetical protein